MSDSNWMRYTPHVVSLICFLVLVATPLIDQHQETERRNHAATKEYEESKKILPLGGVPKRRYTDPKSYREERRGEEDLYAQRQMSTSAFYTMLATVIGVILLVVTLALTRLATAAAVNAAESARDAVDVTRELGRDQIRAYVTVATHVLQMHPSTDPPFRPHIAFSATNSGLSPAEELSMRVRWQICRGDDVVFDHTCTAPEPYVGLISVGGNNGTGSLPATCDQAVPDDLIEAIKRHDAFIRIGVVLTYKTIAGCIRQRLAYTNQGFTIPVQETEDHLGIKPRVARIPEEQGVYPAEQM